MLYKIAREITTTYIDSLSFADRTGGLVRTMIDNRMGEKSYPIEVNQDKTVGDNQYMRKLTPDSNLTSLMYWEQGTPPSITAEHNHFYQAEAQIKLVCWFNYQKVNPMFYDPSFMIAEIVSAIPFKLGNFDCLAAVTCSYAGEEINNGDAFSKYTYNEGETQFFKYPYDYFVLNFDVSYRVVRNCEEEGLTIFPSSSIALIIFGLEEKTVLLAGVSGREYQIKVGTEGLVAHTLSALSLHEFSGENQTHTFQNTFFGETAVLRVGYGAEYLRSISASAQYVSGISIPSGQNIKLEYIDLSDNQITSESNLISLINFIYSSGVNNGTMDISGGTNASIFNETAIGKINTLINDRGWTIDYNYGITLSMTVGGDGSSFGYYYGYIGSIVPDSVPDGNILLLTAQPEFSPGVPLGLIMFWITGNLKMSDADDILIDFGTGGSVTCSWDGVRYSGTNVAVSNYVEANLGLAIDIILSTA